MKQYNDSPHDLITIESPMKMHSNKNRSLVSRKDVIVSTSVHFDDLHLKNQKLPSETPDDIRSSTHKKHEIKKILVDGKPI